MARTTEKDMQQCYLGRDLKKGLMPVIGAGQLEITQTNDTNIKQATLAQGDDGIPVFTFNDMIIKNKAGANKYKIDNTKFMTYGSLVNLGHSSYPWNVIYGNTFKGKRSTSEETVTAGSNHIDLTLTNNFDITAVAGVITVNVTEDCVGQGGVIYVRSGDLITGYPTIFKWAGGGTTPALAGGSTIQYYVKSLTTIICTALVDIE